MTNNSFKGVWIPKEVFEMKELTLVEKVCLSIIIFLSKGERKCTATNKYFAELLGVGNKRASEIINSLSRKKRIGIDIHRDRDTKEVKERVCVFLGGGIPGNMEEIKDIFNSINIKKEFHQIVTEWLDYKKSKKQPYESIKSIQIFVDMIDKLSEGNLNTAIEIIHYSIANNYDGVFPLTTTKFKTGQILKSKNEIQKHKMLNDANW